MKVAYLINQYPKVSHTFVRREIAALQADGIQILRYSIRRFPEPLVDPLDQAEALQTHVLLAGPKWRMLATVAAAALIRPIHFLRALRTTLRMARRSDRGLIRHLAYLTEACLLHRRLARHGIGHVHAHFGTNSATVALLTPNASAIVRVLHCVAPVGVVWVVAVMIACTVAAGIDGRRPRPGASFRMAARPPV